uniref:Uncharacterized protein n=1 Tax=Panagrolaimus superbus TaxID=310955 RepID=A0A914Y0F4_9BILA
MILFGYIFVSVYTIQLSLASALDNPDFGSMDLFNGENMAQAFVIQAPSQASPTVSSIKDFEDGFKKDVSNVKAISQRRMLYLPFLRTMRSAPTQLQQDSNDDQNNFPWQDSSSVKPNQLQKVSYKYFI